MKRTIIGTAALAAAGLFGSLPFDGSAAAQGVPTQHHEVALVDVTSDAEITYNNAIQTDIVAPNGFEDSVYTTFEPNSAQVLDTTGTGAVFDGGSATSYYNDYDGGATQLYNGYLADTVAVEDELNGLLGVQSADQGALYTALEGEYVGGLPSSVAPGADFDSSLSALAGTDDEAALSDFSAYTTYFLDNASGGYFTDATLTTELAALENLGSTLGTDFSTLLTGLFGSL